MEGEPRSTHMQSSSSSASRRTTAGSRRQMGGVHRPGRHGHTANVVGNQIWLFGGKQGSDDLYDITVLDFSGMFGDGSEESLGMAITQSVGGVDKEEDDKDGKGKEVAADEDVVEIEG